MYNGITSQKEEGGKPNDQGMTRVGGEGSAVSSGKIYRNCVQLKCLNIIRLNWDPIKTK